jgi:hypothetical protein
LILQRSIYVQLSFVCMSEPRTRTRDLCRDNPPTLGFSTTYKTARATLLDFRVKPSAYWIKRQQIREGAGARCSGRRLERVHLHESAAGGAAGVDFLILHLPPIRSETKNLIQRPAGDYSSMQIALPRCISWRHSPNQESVVSSHQALC